MNRRDFNRSLLAPIGAAMLPTPLLDAAAPPRRTGRREYVTGLMREAELEVTVDAAGNLAGRTGQ